MKRHVLVAIFFGLALMVVSAAPAMADWAGVSQCFINGKWVTVKGNCPVSGGGGSSAPSYDYEAERQRQEAERQRQLEAERQKQREIDEQRKQDEEAAKKKQEEFDQNKKDALNSMKGFGGDELGLKGTDSGGLGLKEIGDTGKGNLGLKGLDKNKAIDEAQSNLYNTTEKSTPGAVFDTKGGKSPRSYLAVMVPATGQPIQLSDRAKKDQRMIKILKELEALQLKRQKLDAERTKLAKERFNTKNQEETNQLTKKLDKAESDYQKNLLAASNTYEKVEKLKRTIDAEVEKPVSGN